MDERTERRRTDAMLIAVSPKRFCGGIKILKSINNVLLTHTLWPPPPNADAGLSAKAFPVHS